MPLPQSESNSRANANGSNSFGHLFSHERSEELAQALFEKVASGLYTPHRIHNADIRRVVSDLVEEASQGPFKRLYVERNDDGSFRALCTGCEIPWCCIVFETIRLTDQDVWTLSKRLAISIKAFLKSYCEQHNDDTQPDFVYKLKKAEPCVFLCENQCSIYTDRPERCKHFPLQRDDTGYNFRIYSWCNYLFNLLWHEATLRTLELILQKDRLSQRRIRYGRAISTGKPVYHARE